VQFLIRESRPTALALATAAVIPFFHAIIDFVRTRRIGVIAILVVIGLALGAILALATGNAVFALLQGSLVTGFFGLAFLFSLAAQRPLIYVLARQYSSGDDPCAADAWDARWNEHRPFRARMRLLTLVWGAALFGEAAARVMVTVSFSSSRAAIVSPLLDAATILALILFTIVFARWAARRA
jgi:hypothetical protein